MRTVTEFLDNIEVEIACIFDADKGYDGGQHVSCLTPRQRMVLEELKARVLPLARHAAALAEAIEMYQDDFCLGMDEAQEAYQKTISKIEGGE